jgi:hypothetical protein
MELKILLNSKFNPSFEHLSFLFYLELNWPNNFLKINTNQIQIKFKSESQLDIALIALK